MECNIRDSFCSGYGITYLYSKLFLVYRTSCKATSLTRRMYCRFVLRGQARLALPCFIHLLLSYAKLLLSDFQQCAKENIHIGHWMLTKGDFYRSGLRGCLNEGKHHYKAHLVLAVNMLMYSLF